MTTTNTPERYRGSAVPHAMVDGAGRAIAFYTAAFGADELFRVATPDGTVVHAEIAIEGSVVMVGDADAPFSAPRPGATSVGLHVYVADVDDLAARAVAAGAEMLQEPADMFYGDRSVMLRDPFGHVWVFLAHQEDLSPAEIVERGRVLLGG